MPSQPSEPRLVPGTPVLRRDAEHLQVGLEPDRCVVVRDEPDVRRALAALRDGAPARPVTIAAHEALRRLGAAGLLRDPAADRAAAEALARLRVGLDVPADLEATTTSTLASVGVRAADDDPTAVLVVRDGPVAREELDDLVRDGVPHLLVSASPHATTVGPFVVPGHTACLRCLDAHRADLDPRWPVVVAQAAEAPPVPRSPLLLPMALRWAAGDLRALALGRAPSTWSATVRVDEGLRPERTEWSRHPGCGCAWGEALTG